MPILSAPSFSLDIFDNACSLLNMDIFDNACSLLNIKFSKLITFIQVEHFRSDLRYMYVQFSVLLESPALNFNEISPSSAG